MRLYAIAMFVHILGVVALFGSFVLINRAGPRLRRATHFETARPWAELLFTMRTMMPAGIVMLLASGGYLAWRFGARQPAWVAVSAAALLMMGAVAFVVVLPYLSRAHRALAEGTGTLTPDAIRAIRRPIFTTVVGSANAAAMGVLWLMTSRPGPLESLLVVIALGLAGAAIGVLQARRS